MSGKMSILPNATKRVIFREANEGDAEFIFNLVNSPGWLEFIGDKNVQNIEQAKVYIRDSLVASYKTHGFGIWLVADRMNGQLLGSCGLVNRDSLPDIDIGYAFLPEFSGQGLATEAGAAVLSFAQSKLGVKKILAIVSHGNAASIRVLEKLSFADQGDHVMGLNDDGSPDSVLLFSRDF